MVEYKKIGTIGVILAILTGSIYFMWPENVKINVSSTKTDFFVWEDGQWLLGASEYVKLYNGSKVLTPTSKVVSYETSIGRTVIIRNNSYPGNRQFIHKYVFDSNVTNVELVPIESTFECVGCEGLIAQFEYQKLSGVNSSRVANNPESFGHRMNVEWQEGAYFAKISDTLTNDKLTIKYRINGSYERFSVRMFDPWYNASSGLSSNNTGLETQLQDYYTMDANDRNLTSGKIYNMFNLSRHNMTIYGTTALSIGGVLNEGIRTNGVDNVFNTSENQQFQNTEQVSLNFWMYNNASNNQKRPVGFWGTGSTCGSIDSFWTVLEDNGATYNLTTSTDCGYGYGGYRVSGLSKDKWYMFTLIRNGTNSFQVWVNGTNAGGFTTTGGFTSGAILQRLKFGNTPIYNSSTDGYSTSWFNGSFDEIGLWNKSLNASEIQQLYNNNYSLSYRNFTNNTSSTTVSNFTINGYSQNLSVEAGSNLSLSANLSGNGTICLDSNHPQYGLNFSCGTNPITTSFNPTYFRTTTLNDSTSVKNITVSNLYSSFDSLNWCYQESANVSTYCGGLATGSYNYTGAWSVSPFTANNSFDGSWATAGQGLWLETSNIATLYVNYTKPLNATDASRWQVKTNFSGQILTNYSIPSACWNQTKLYFKLQSWNHAVASEHVLLSCYNGSVYQLIANISSRDASPMIYEEAMWWNINNVANQSVFISTHQYDEVSGLQFNLSQYAVGGVYPSNVRIWINNTLTYSLPSLFGNQTQFNDTSSSKLQYLNPVVTYNMGYLKVKGNQVNSVKFNITGLRNNASCYQESPDVQPDCTNNTRINTTIAYTNIVGHYGGGCFNGDGITYANLMYDGNWDTGGMANPYYYYEGENGAYKVIYNMSPNNDYNNTYLQFKYDYWNQYNCFAYGGPHPTTLNVSVAQCGHSANNLTFYFDLISEDQYGCQGFGSGMTFNIKCWNVSDYITIYNVHESMGVSCVELYEEGLFHYNTTSYPNNTWIELGTVDGVRDWNNTQIFQTSQSVTVNSSNVASLNTYINTTCSIDSNGFCNIPITAYSNKAGYFLINNVEVMYNATFNPIIINVSPINAYLGNSSGFINLPITFTSDTNGTLEVSDLKYDYLGGNKSYWVKAHTTNYSSNIIYNLTYYYSDWHYVMPVTAYNTLEFTPNTPTSKNVSAYAQNVFIPIMNVTTRNYGGVISNFSFYLNESYSCVNLSYSLANITNKVQMINGSWINMSNNLNYSSKINLWLYADYQCNYSTWQLWNPLLAFRACAVGEDICDDGVTNIR